MKAVQVVIEGDVQGVAYRDWAQRNAQALGLDGWVRNRGDGRVEAVFSGDDRAVEHMVDSCRDGPPAAIVRKIQVAEADPPPPGFTILPTR